MAIKHYFRALLTEDKEGKNINRARKYLQSQGFSLEKSQEILDAIRSSMYNARVADCKFLLGITRIYLDHEITNGEQALSLNRILPYIGLEAHITEYDNNLNGLSLNELLDKFSGIVQQDAEKSRADSYALSRTKNNDYTIIRISNFEDASKYSNYTSWCVTQSSVAYKNYTNNGLGLFYFCLKSGFENIQEVKGENCPLDEYGLSMIAVSITKDGEPNTITCRWNHDNGGNDKVMSKRQLEDLLGVNFYEVFRPYSKEEIEQRNIEITKMFKNANDKLEKGEPINTVFDRIAKITNDTFLVRLNGVYSILGKDNRLINDGDLWFDSVHNIEEGATAVNRQDKWSFIKYNGELVGNGKLWFDHIEPFSEGFSVVSLNGKKTFIDNNGEFIGNGKLWFDDAQDFIFDFAPVRVNNKWSFINRTGDLIGEGNLWFDGVYNFNEGLACVKKNNKYSYINTKGKLIGSGNLWFDRAYNFSYGEATVGIKGEFYNIDYFGNFYDALTNTPISNPIKESKRNEKTIIVSENVFSGGLLTENRESKNINLARRYLRENGYSLDKAQEILDAIRSDMHNARVADSKFLLGIVRLYLNGELKDGTSIFNLNRILPYIGSDAHVDEYKPNLNDLSLEELVKRFSGIAQQDADKSRADSYAKEHVRNNEYIIVRIPSYNVAKEYGRYTSWCVTHSKGMYRRYTNDSFGLFYFCLKNGFESVKEVKGENCPLDEYGLSMIAVSITEDGNPNTITCRWNHDNGGNDKIMSKDQLEDLLGVNFYEVFKPYSKEEIAKKKDELMRPFRKANERLKKGEPLNSIFEWVDPQPNGCTIVKLKNKYSYVNSNNELIKNGELWFDYVDKFVDGFAPVTLANKSSLLDTNFDLIGDGNVWFDCVDYFRNGFSKVYDANKGWSFINTKGELISNLWFTLVRPFNEGFAAVLSESNGWSFINTKGELIMGGKVWFKKAHSFSNGLASVYFGNNGWTFVNTKGKFIGDGKLWFDNVDGFNDGWASVELDGKKTFINTKGEFIGNGKLWFDNADMFNDGFARVELNDKGYSFINTKGEFIKDGKLWFSDASNFINGLAVGHVRGGTYLVINTKEEIIRGGKFGFINAHNYQDGLYVSLFIDNEVKVYKMDKDCNFYDAQTNEPVPSPIKENKARRKTIIINEGMFKRTLLTEDREGKNINYARKYLKEKGYSLERAQEILDSIRSDMHNARVADCKFLLGVARLYLTGELNNGKSIASLNRILPYIGSDAHVNEYNPDLNNLSLTELVDRFSGLADQDANRSRAESNAVKRIKNDNYTIVRIPNFEKASNFGEYTTWCVTHDKDMYQRYTNDGLGLFYFCLKDGFEKVIEKKGENCPLDEYGLSMIAVSVTEDGEPNTITCRWNHDNGGNDKIMTKNKLEELLGVNFYEAFKPYSEEEIVQKKEELMRPFREAKKKLELGFSPRDIFSYVDEPNEGFSAVGLNYKYSFINSNNELIGDGELWFDYVWPFTEGFAAVEVNTKHSFINTKGEFINNGELWFDDTNYFSNGFALVGIDDRWSFINTKGELIGNGKLWFDEAWSFSDGFAAVEVENRYSFINTEGKLIGDGKLWFEYCDSFKSGFAKIKLDHKWSFIDTSLDLIGNGNLWFDKVQGFQNGFSVIKLNGKGYSFINTEGKLIGNGKLWFDVAWSFSDGFAGVKLGDKESFIDTKGKLIGNGKLWFDYVNYFVNGLAIVGRSGKWSFINTEGKLIGNGKLWFDEAWNFSKRFATVELNDKHYHIDKDGNFYDINTKQPIPNPLKENKQNKKTIIVNESMFKRTLLTEDREGKNINYARKYLKEKGYYLEESQKILDAIRSSIPNSRIADCKFLLGVTRMFLNREFRDTRDIFNLNRTLSYLGSEAHINEYDRNLNNESLTTLVDRFSTLIKQDAEKSRAESYNKRHIKKQ